jgi:hypothetical protein
VKSLNEVVVLKLRADDYPLKRSAAKKNSYVDDLNEMWRMRGWEM